jgi:PAS domain S-box-containing protein
MKKTILIVDDNHVMLKRIKEILENMGHCVMTTDNAVAALDVVLSFVPDILFIDLMMPDFSGDKLSCIIKKMPHLSACRIVMVSSGRKPKYDYKKMGVAACVAKGSSVDMAANISEVMRKLEKEGKDNRRICLKNGQPGEPCQIKDDHHLALEHLLDERTEELKCVNEQLLIEISERRHLDERYQESEAIWKNIYDAITDCICLLNLEGRILHCNEAMSVLLKLPQKTISGHNLWDVFNHTKYCEIRDLFFRVQEKMQKQKVRLTMHKTYADISMTPIFDERYFFIGAVCIFKYPKRGYGFMHKPNTLESVNFIPLS